MIPRTLGGPTLAPSTLVRSLPRSTALPSSDNDHIWVDGTRAGPGTAWLGHGVQMTGLEAGADAFRTGAVSSACLVPGTGR
jgi:hypothetical protein